MQYTTSKRFEKQFLKLSRKDRERVSKAILLFLQDPTNKKLRNHALHGRWRGHYSIDAAGDMRAIYFVIEEDVVRFMAVGTHSQLYGT